MKRLKLSTVALLSLFCIMFTACEKELESPEICYELSIIKEGETVVLSEPYTVTSGQTLMFTNCGSADFYSFFPGLQNQSWAEYKESGKAVAAGYDTDPSGNASFKYITPGTYVATIVLTNRKMGSPKESKEEIVNFEITVKEATETE